eukprot:6370020-Pyramimonas_sp.AAC.1
MSALRLSRRVYISDDFRARHMDKATLVEHAVADMGATKFKLIDWDDYCVQKGRKFVLALVTSADTAHRSHDFPAGSSLTGPEFISRFSRVDESSSRYGVGGVASSAAQARSRWGHGVPRKHSVAGFVYCCNCGLGHPQTEARR